MNSALIVVSHPDDETLGCGATAVALAALGVSVRTCILSGRADARQNRPTDPELEHDTKRAHRILGLEPPILGNFPNILFNTVPHLGMVQFIEAAMTQVHADVIFTHHPADLNNDHMQTSQACQAAARLFQRNPKFPQLRGLYFIEVLSSTDWAFPSGLNAFRPDTFFEIGEEFLNCKLEALRAYRGVMRPFPHPRSEEVVRSLAAFRGGQSGMRYAEAFQTAFRAMTPAEFSK